jgi:hypothetical protein
MAPRIRTLAALCATLGLMLAAPAQGAFNSVLQELIRQGFVNPCAHSESELRQALGQIPNDLAQYAPDIKGRLQAALAAKARGQCAGGGGGQIAPVAPPTVTPGGTPPPAPPTPTKKVVVKAPPEPPATPIQRVVTPPTAVEIVPTSSEAGVPAPLIALAMAFLLLAMAAALAGASRVLGWGLEWGAPVRHAFAEAGDRLATAWEDLGDRLRLRR